LAEVSQAKNIGSEASKNVWHQLQWKLESESHFL